MAHSHFDEDSRDAADDHWIFEELGSPVKSRRMKSSTAHEASSHAKKSPTKGADKNEFDEKLQIYANNMRKLIITARKEIKNLKEENLTLKRKLESSGLIECPACLFRFKPRKEHRVLPKYMKVFRGRLSLEIEFNSLDQMNHWLIENQLDTSSDGLPTMLAVTESEKDNLVSTGSLLPQLVKERYEKSKSEKVVISTRPVGKGPHQSVSEETRSERKYYHDRKVSSEIPSTSRSPESTVKECLDGDHKRNRNASSGGRDRSSKSISSDEFQVRSGESSESGKEEAMDVVEKEEIGREGEDTSATTGCRSPYQKQHLKAREVVRRRLQDTRSVENRHSCSPVETSDKHSILDEKLAEPAVQKTSKEIGKENLHNENHSNRMKDHKENLHKGNCSNHEKKRKSLDHESSHRSKRELTSDDNRSSRKTSVHNALPDGPISEHGKERKKEKDDRTRSRNSKEDSIRNDPRRHRHSHLRCNGSSHPSNTSHKRSSADKEKTVAPERCKLKEEFRKHDRRRSPTRGVDVRKRSLEAHDRTYRSGERHSRGHVRRNSDSRSHRILRTTSKQSDHHHTGRDARKRSRSRDQPRKRAGKEVLRDVSPGIKRRCSSPRPAEHQIDEMQHAASKISSPNTQNSAEIELESPLSPDEYDSPMSDADLVIVDEEEVEDGEILE